MCENLWFDKWLSNLYKFGFDNIILKNFKIELDSFFNINVFFIILRTFGLSLVFIIFVSYII